jgi:transposase
LEWCRGTVRILRRARPAVARASGSVPVTPTGPPRPVSLYAPQLHPLREGGSVGAVFIFRNRTADRLKVLYWGGHGLCLWCQRLESGRYHFPDATDANAGIELTPGQFQMILDGIDLSRVRRFKRFSTTPA